MHLAWKPKAGTVNRLPICWAIAGRRSARATGAPGLPRLRRSIACAIDRPLEFRSGLLRLNGEQRLPGMAEMLGREGIEWLRPLRCEQLHLTAEEGVEEIGRA